jgi:hypothetical protein
MKLTGTQKALLAGLDTAKAVLNEATKDYWKNIKLPSDCAAVPTVRAIGPRETKAAEGLVAAGLLVPIASNVFIAPWKP